MNEHSVYKDILRIMCGTKMCFYYRHVQLFCFVSAMPRLTEGSVLRERCNISNNLPESSVNRENGMFMEPLLYDEKSLEKNHIKTKNKK